MKVAPGRNSRGKTVFFGGVVKNQVSCFREKYVSQAEMIRSSECDFRSLRYSPFLGG